MNLFYTPEYAKTGDVIPFYNEAAGRFDHFYLKNWNPDAPKDKIVHGWHRISTVDNRNYQETPTAIRGGTGSVICVDGVYHMFYCTFEWNPNSQWARHATSTDLEHWSDIPEDKFTADGEIYLKSDWRDPFVFWKIWKKSDGTYTCIVSCCNTSARMASTGAINMCSLPTTGVSAICGSARILPNAAGAIS